MDFEDEDFHPGEDFLLVQDEAFLGSLDVANHRERTCRHPLCQLRKGDGRGCDAFLRVGGKLTLQRADAGLELDRR